ncbi:MAG: acylphosphatase, partial [Deltaproteobacteria bacterium]
MPRRSVTIFGTVQGVGFRPHVFRLARRLGLEGFVRNRDGNVQVEVEGDATVLDRFLDLLARDPPHLARIERVESKPLLPRAESGFRIEPSDTEDDREIHVAPDVATCTACRDEMLDDANRRFRYPFLNCTQCGPRFTILEATPYDRERTTMAGFTLCPECRREYDDPADRRFHAQPTACAKCGPRLELVDALGRTATSADPLERAIASLQRGEIGAIKGLGGYHLVCDATSGRTVAELRRRKGRDSKPLAVMVADLQSARALCDVSPDEGEYLGSWRAPIVLLRRRPSAPVADEVSPRNPCLG